MAVEHAVVSSEIRKRLSGAELAEITASLWPVDCQTCGKKLGSAPPTLAVENIHIVASVSLHHPRCRASAWSEDILSGPRGQATLSFATHSMLLPIGAPDGAEPIYYPAMLVNPGLEMVFIGKNDAGGWRVVMPSWFAEAGFAPPGAGFVIDRAVEGAVARTPRGGIAVTIQTPGYDTYDAPLDDLVAGRVRDLGGILVMVTHAVHPHQIRDLTQLTGVFQGDRSL